jgi:SAM-dependent methyltransferase
VVVERSRRACLLCGAGFEGRTFLCRACSDRYRGRPVPLAVRRQFYEALDRQYPARSNTHGDYNAPVELLREIERLPRDVRILELGAGGGFFAQALAARGFSDLTLTDFTATTLAALRARAPGARLVGADAARLPFRAGCFDAVIASDVLEHLPELDVHLAEVARVLRPGGSYFVKTPNRRPAQAYYRLRGLHDTYFWHPSMLAPDELRRCFARQGLMARFLAQPHLTGAQLAKLPGPLRPLAGRVPLGWLPLALRPHLEVVATATNHLTGSARSVK